MTLNIYQIHFKYKTAIATIFMENKFQLVFKIRNRNLLRIFVMTILLAIPPKLNYNA